MHTEFAVAGQIARPDGSPLSGLSVRAFDKDLPSLRARGLDEQKLGEAVTDAEGRYRIAFTGQDFRQGEVRRRGKLRPDLFIRVYDEGDAPLGESAVHYHAEQEVRIDLTVAPPQRSEYESLVREITPVLQGVAMADLTDEDLAFLEGEAGIHEARSSFVSRLVRGSGTKPGFRRIRSSCCAGRHATHAKPTSRPKPATRGPAFSIPPISRTSRRGPTPSSATRSRRASRWAWLPRPSRIRSIRRSAPCGATPTSATGPPGS